MAFTLGQLAAIESAIASGTRSASYDGKTVTYGSLDELLRIRDIIMRALGLVSTDNTTVVAHDRGFPGAIGSGFDSELYSGW